LNLWQKRNLKKQTQSQWKPLSRFSVFLRGHDVPAAVQRILFAGVPIQSMAGSIVNASGEFADTIIQSAAQRFEIS